MLRYVSCDCKVLCLFCCLMWNVCVALWFCGFGLLLFYVLGVVSACLRPSLFVLWYSGVEIVYSFCCVVALCVKIPRGIVRVLCDLCYCSVEYAY